MGALLPAVDELISRSLRPAEPTTSTVSSVTAGPRFEVSQRIQSSILTVVVIISILVSQVQSGATRRPVRRSVSSLPDELVESVYSSYCPEEGRVSCPFPYGWCSS